MEIIILVILFVSCYLIYVIVTQLNHKKFQNAIDKVLSFTEVDEIKNNKINYVKLDRSKIQILKKSIESIYVDETLDYIIAYPKEVANEISEGLFFLHGLGNDMYEWIDKGLAINNYLNLFEQGKIRPLLLIFVNSGNHGKSWYSNFYGQKSKRYEDFFMKEVYSEIKDQWKINRFGIVGYSMGGYGAFKLGIKNLDKFLIIGSFSGATNLVRMAVNRSCLWIFKFLYIPKFLFKSSEEKDFLTVFSSWGYKILKEDPYELMKKVPKSLIDKRYFYLSVGKNDYINYKMLQQWIDTVIQLKKLNYKFKGNLCLGEEHTWDYVAEDMKNFLIYFEEKLGE
ncbi:alpha/beta hydrolase-fold protein [Fusobacterium sp. PH5-44]|uniref:alpha/beta hydrolase-fold protein n=1 Tax=unclassified Fusobacterium TaxID=2648384 RepID=UPI003D1ABD79